MKKNNNLAISMALVTVMEAGHAKTASARMHSQLISRDTPPSIALLGAMFGHDKVAHLRPLSHYAVGPSEPPAVKSATAMFGKLLSKVQPAMQWAGGAMKSLGNKIPQGTKNYLTAHPLRGAGLAGLAGGIGAGGGVMGANMYADHRRRKAIRNMGFGNRLGLAFQLMANPQGFANLL